MLQSRPITTLHGHNLKTGEWNDSLTGDFLWTTGNFGEAVPGIMSPYSWSLIRIYFDEERQLHILGKQHPTVGNIGGRLYMNVSVWVSAAAGFGVPPHKVINASAVYFGHIPDQVDIPLIPLSPFQALAYAPDVSQAKKRLQKTSEALPEFIREAPQLARKMQARIQSVTDPTELAALWCDTLEPLFRQTAWSLLACNHHLQSSIRRVQKGIKEAAPDVNMDELLAGWSTDSDYIESLGPLLGLVKVARGELDRDLYLGAYGHRGSEEFEFSIPRPIENPDWIDHQLAGLTDQLDEIEALLAHQQMVHEDAWQRLTLDYPHLKPYRDRIGEAIELREKARSEVTRLIGLARTFALRAGEFTGTGDDIFFLLIEEVLSLLEGLDDPTPVIPARRKTDAQYRQLPPLPNVIRGRFDPFAWAANPDRRHDLFDASRPSPPASDEVIKGFAGAAGITEGPVRVLRNLDEARQLKKGEILVTSTMNIGWSILFPKCAAIVTDVGAPLSHAAIVARELGIPAVVGCGNATTLLRTGDRVRVNGLGGLVEILSKSEP